MNDQKQSIVEQCGELYKSLRSVYGPTHGFTTTAASLYANLHPRKVSGLNDLKRSINFDARGDEPFTGLTFEQKMAEIRKSNAKELPLSDLSVGEIRVSKDAVTTVEYTEPKKRGPKKKLAAEGENETEPGTANDIAE